MRVIEVRDGRVIESLAVVERPDPFPGPGQISAESADGGHPFLEFRFPTASVLLLPWLPECLG